MGSRNPPWAAVAGVLHATGIFLSLTMVDAEAAGIMAHLSSTVIETAEFLPYPTMYFASSNPRAQGAHSTRLQAVHKGLLTTLPCRLYQQYTFELAPGHDKGPLELRTGITIGPADGVWVTVKPRE